MSIQYISIHKDTLCSNEHFKQKQCVRVNAGARMLFRPPLPCPVGHETCQRQQLRLLRHMPSAQKVTTEAFFIQNHWRRSLSARRLWTCQGLLESINKKLTKLEMLETIQQSISELTPSLEFSQKEKRQTEEGEQIFERYCT